MQRTHYFLVCLCFVWPKIYIFRALVTYMGLQSIIQILTSMVTMWHIKIIEWLIKFRTVIELCILNFLLMIRRITNFYTTKTLLRLYKFFSWKSAFWEVLSILKTGGINLQQEYTLHFPESSPELITRLLSTLHNT